MTAERHLVFLNRRMAAILRNWIGAVLLAICCLLACGTAAASPTIIFTVDVESNEHLPLPTQVDAICANGSRCGLMQISALLKQHGFAGTFFLNVYEYRKWGESPLRDIARRLQADGHEVALHTHPQWAYDPQRPNMFDYSLEEQTQIVREGSQMLQRWIGAPVMSHRAGAYTADENTLTALAASDIHVDSSLFFRHPLSRLNGLGLPSNLPAVRGPILEIPVTVYWREDRPDLLPGLFTPTASIRKVDPDWFVDEAEANRALDALLDADLPYILVFLHSFTLLDGSSSAAAPVENARTQRIFALLLERIAAAKLPTAKMRDVTPDTVIAGGSDVIPRVGVSVPSYKYWGHKLRSHASAGQLAVSGTILIVFFIIALRLALRRRAAR